MFFQLAHTALHQAFGVPGLAAIGRFKGGVNHREQRHHGNTQLDALFGHGQQHIHRHARHSRHGAHVFPLASAIQHKHGVDQIVRSQGVFAHQVAGESVSAQAAGAALGEGRKGGNRGK